MANQKIIEGKQKIVEEIVDKVKKSNCFVLTVSETNELRRNLRKSGSDFKIYKNTLAKRAMKELNIDFDSCLEGPKALAFGTDSVEPIKVLSEFAKKTNKLELKVGYVDGSVADKQNLEK